MQIVGRDTAIEKQILVGVIVSDTFLKRLHPLVQPAHLALPSVGTVMGWVSDYFSRYGKAPGRELMNIFEERRGGLQEAEAEWIGGFLSELSAEWEGRESFNEEYLFDRSVQYLRSRRLRVSAKAVQALLDKGRDEQAEALWLAGLKMPATDHQGIDPFDSATVKRMFTEEDARHALGIGVRSIDRMVGPVKSGWLAVFLGPMKRGKTQALKHVAVRGWAQGYDVVFVSLETEERDMALRFWADVGSLALVGTGEGRVSVDFPKFANKEKGSSVVREKQLRPEVNKGSVLRAVRKAQRATAGRLRVRAFPMGMGGIKEIRQYLDMIEVYENFYPHVIVVDYIGAMAAPVGIRGRDTEYNYNSMALKALAQERRAIVFSGHQGTRETLDKINSSASDTSQDIRVFANLDVMYTLNQTEEEADANVMRIGVGGHRHSQYSRRKQALVLQQFNVGQFALDDMLVDAPFGGMGARGGQQMKGGGRGDQDS